MELKVPKTKADLRIKHLPVLSDQRLNEPEASIELQVDVIKAFTGVSAPQLHTLLVPDLNKVFSHLMSIIASIDVKADVPDEITLSGQTFIRIDPWKAPSGWHADYAKSDFVADPVRLACMCYIPKGSFYGELDQHDNLVHPISSRHQLFTDEFPLETYIALTAFFLTKFGKLMNDYTVRLKRDSRNLKIKNRIAGFGKNFSTRLRRNTE